MTVAVVASAGLLAACGSGDDSGGTSTTSGEATVAGPTEAASTGTGGGHKLAIFALGTANAYGQSELKGVKQAIAETGSVADYFDGKEDSSVQLKQIQDAVATGDYEGFVVFAAGGAAIVPGVEEAAAEGIYTVAAYAPIGASADPEPQVEGVIGTVLHPNKENGYQIGLLVVGACQEQHPEADPCQVAYLSGSNDIVFEQWKMEGFNEAIATSSQAIEVVSQQEGGWLTGQARTATENILQAHPDIDVIAATGDQMAVGAQQAVDDAGLTGISFVGDGTTNEGIERIAAGEWYGSAVMLPQDEGYLATMMMIDYLDGKGVTTTVVDVVATMGTAAAITKANYEGFEPQWSAEG
ncbi:MAG: sugar ABC transporter substrate-binding protein [Bifidobacteriaceae bacterium]|nr:sugar ABC transporter substrate-binding protein [Bifidobacteriaceae bacterium]